MICSATRRRKDLSYNNLSGPLPKITARTFNVIGNPLICGSKSGNNCSSMSLDPISYPPDDLKGILGFSAQPQSGVARNHRYAIKRCFHLIRPQSGVGRNHRIAIAFGVSVGCVALLIVGVGLLLWWQHRHNQQVFFDVNERRIEFEYDVQCTWEY